MTDICTRAGIALCLLIGVAGHARAQPTTGPWPLVDVRFEGLSRYSAGDVVRLSGLEPGAPITLDQVQQSANRLMQTGLFQNLGFSYSTTPQGLTLTLKVVEAAWTVPLVFDNIIWMTDAEFSAALATRVPGFSGMAVDQGQANAFIAAAAERVLAERGISGRVQLEPRLDVRTSATTYALVVRDTGVSMRVCDLRLPGASAIRERGLLDLGRGFVGAEYSKANLVTFANSTLQQLYRERGHWAARFEPPRATPVTGTCDGLAVSMAVSEGLAYTFGGVRWTGVSSLEAGPLDRAINLRPGSTADVRRLEDGLRAVERAYHERGYVTMQRVIRPEFDDEAKRVTFAIEVQEGPQFRMGTLSTSGLTDRQAREITGRWRVKPGEVFDGVYYREFADRETDRMGGALRVAAALDTQTSTVTVTLTGF